MLLKTAQGKNRVPCFSVSLAIWSHTANSVIRPYLNQAQGCGVEVGVGGGEGLNK